MRSGPGGAAALLLLGALAAGQETPFADDAPLPADGAVVVELAADDPFLSNKGRGRWFRLLAERDGPLTIDVESHDLDVFLHVRDETNAQIASDMGSGVEWNAHLVLEAEAGRAYRVGALAASAELGSIRVSVRPGVHPVPEGRALLRARVAFNEEAARRARERGDGEALSQFLLNAGNLSFNLGDLAAAAPHLQALLALAGERGDAARETFARAFLGAIDVRWHLPRRALERLEPALQGARELGHGAVERFVLDNLGEARSDLHRRGEAVADWQALLDGAREAGDTASVVVALRKLGRARARLGQSAEGRRLLEEAVATAGSLGSADTLAEALVALGEDHLRRAEMLDALDCFERALGSGAGEEWRMKALGSLGNVHLHAGRYDDARDSYERVLEWAQASGVGSVQATARHNLGLVDFHLGSLHAALEELDAALSLADEDDASFRALVHYHRGAAWAMLEQPVRERTELEAALALARQADLADEELLFLARLGGWALSQDREDEARRFLAEAEARLSPDASEAVRGVVATKRATVALHAGDLDAVDRLAREGADLLLGWGAVHAAFEPLDLMARSALARGDIDTVEAVLAEAELLRGDRVLAGLAMDERAGSRHAISLDEIEADLVALRLARTGDDAARRADILAEGFRDAGRWKGRALLEGLGVHRRAPEAGEAASLRREHDALLADRGELSSAMARTRVAPPDPSSGMAALEARDDALRRRLDEVSSRLRTVAPRAALLAAPRPIGPDEARAALLADGRVLIDYVQGERTVYAYVLTADELAFVDLGTRDEIEDACRRHLSGMSDPDRLASVAEVVATGSELYRRVLAPALAAVGGTARRLLVVPCGELSLVPFESLVVQGEGAERFADVEFVLDRMLVGYGPSTPVLVALAEASPRAGPVRAVVLGDPVYPVERPALGRFEQRGVPRADQLARLPATRDEALAVAAVVLERSGEDDALQALGTLRDERSAALRTGAVDLYLGEQATPERLRGDLTGYTVVHCASHGYADPEDPRRSGLVLAFAAGRAGYVPLADVLDLRLDAELTVLSACRTAQGRVLRGEGVQSVARAFLHAGSRGVVASLWQVADAETAFMMQRFYEGWIAGGQRPDSTLRAAKLALREGVPIPSSALRGGLLRAPPASRPRDATGHPYYWAPFVHIGRP